MRIIVLYRPNSEYGRPVEEFIRDYQAQEGDRHLEVLSLDSRDGAATASLYDVMEYPAILALQDDGYLHKLWQGAQLPLMNEVAAYARG